jgi:hypothetical protein
MKTPLETIAKALFDLGCSVNSQATPLKSASRRWLHWDSVGAAAMPAFFQRQRSPVLSQAKHFGLTKYMVYFEWWLYIAVNKDDKTTPTSPLMNNYFKAFDDILKPTLQAPGGKQQLGGPQIPGKPQPPALVENCWMDGTVGWDEGEISPPAIIMMPISVILGQ